MNKDVLRQGNRDAIKQTYIKVIEKMYTIFICQGNEMRNMAQG